MTPFAPVKILRIEADTDENPLFLKDTLLF
jgi:hypothetical protein